MTAFLVLACSGCTVPLFKSPLGDPEKAKPAPELIGTYRQQENSENCVSFLHIGSAGEGYPQGFLRILAVNQPTRWQTALKPESTIGFIKQIGDDHILHIPLDGSSAENPQSAWQKKWDAGKVTGYILVRLKVKEDQLTLTFLESNFIETQIEKKKLPGKVVVPADPHSGIATPNKKSVTVTATSSELRRFFREHGEAVFGSKPVWEIRFTRVK